MWLQRKRNLFSLVLIFKGFVESDFDDQCVVPTSDSSDLIFDDDNDELEINDCVSEKENQVTSGIYFHTKEIFGTFPCS